MLRLRSFPLSTVRNHCAILFAALMAIAGSSLPLPAQSITSTVLGTVKDPSGRVIAAAKVELVNKGTDARRSTVTSETGDFRFSDIDAGSYTLTIEAPGFQKEEFTQFDLLARETRRLDSSMKVATAAQSVSVNSDVGPAIQTDTSNISETKTGRELVDLPVAINSRSTGSTSPITALTTQPGVQIDNAGNIGVGGSTPAQLSVSLDGLSVTGARASETGPINELFPSFNAIEEIRVSEVINPAEFGGVADVATISKSGTNSYHGGVFENFQNTELNATNTFTHTTPLTKMNNFGIFMGGPVSIPKLYNGKNKTFFFTSYEALRLPKSVIQIENVPSVAMRNGDLTALGGPVVAPSLIAPFTAKILNYLYPLPNFGIPGATTNNYAAVFPTPINTSQADLRLDENISSRQSVFVRLLYKNRRVEVAPTATAPSSPSALLGSYSEPEIDYSVAAGYTFIISPTLINDVRGGLAGNHYSLNFGITGPQAASELGMTGLNFSVPTVDAVPNVIIAGYQGTGGTAGNAGANRSIQLMDTLTWTKGKHTIKTGADYRYLTALYTCSFCSRQLGKYTFNGSVTSSLLSGGVITPYEPFQAFLLGIPDSDSIASVVQTNTEAYASHYAVFVQDDWKINSHLTVNFGMRWEYHPMFQDHLQDIATFLPNYVSYSNGSPVHGAFVIPSATAPLDPYLVQSIYPTPVLTAAQAGLPNGGLRFSQRTDFAPRAGFAWNPFRGTVIRGGYGRFIEALMGSLVDDGWGVNGALVSNYTNTIANGKAQYTFPYPFPSNLAQPGTQGFYNAYDSTHYLDPYVNEWDLTVEQDLGKGIGLRVSYDGSAGHNLGIIANVNEVSPNTVGFATANLSAPFPLWQYIAYGESGGISHYNAATVSVKKRFTGGLQFQASYTFTRNLADNGGYAPTSYVGGGGGTITNQFQPTYDYGNVAFSRRSRFLLTFLYELPFGKGKTFLRNGNGLVDRVVGGWEVAGVYVGQSGPFMSIQAGTDPAGTGFPELVADGRADTVKGVSPYAGQSLNQWINPAAFATPPNNIGRYADSQVGAVTGPGTESVSLSLFKSIQIRESIRMQIGASAANAFNHPNYLAPGDLVLGSAGFGQITNQASQEGAGPRQIQLTGRITF
jgi:hypothetical protein